MACRYAQVSASITPTARMHRRPRYPENPCLSGRRPRSTNDPMGCPQIDYSGNDGTIGDFPTDTPLGLVPSYIYSYDSTGAPTTLPADDACEARFRMPQTCRARL